MQVKVDLEFAFASAAWNTGVWSEGCKLLELLRIIGNMTLNPAADNSDSQNFFPKVSVIVPIYNGEADLLD